MKTALVYDPYSTHIGTVRDHALSIGNAPGIKLDFFPARSAENLFLNSRTLRHYECVICHYSVRLPSMYFAPFLNALAEFPGRKALFIQDEYDHVELTRNWMDKIGFDVVFTCVPETEIEKVYPSRRFPQTRFVSVLTGYVPEWAEQKTEWADFESRSIDVGYRGRELPWRYGRLGQMKFEIGEEFKARNAGLLRVDISSADEDRIYGEAWLDFLERCRFTLGSESGCNVFDWDGSLAMVDVEFRKKNRAATFADYEAQVIGTRENEVRMNQISPRIFEAIGTKTALILHKGVYSGVIAPFEHYWPLEHDYSNWDETEAFIKDHTAVRQMIERAHNDIVKSRKWNYATFSELVASALLEPDRSKANCAVSLQPPSDDSFNALMDKIRFTSPVTMEELWELGASCKYTSGIPVNWRDRELLHTATGRGLFGAFVMCLLARAIRFVQMRILGHGGATTPRIWKRLPINFKWTQALEHYMDLMRRRII